MAELVTMPALGLNMEEGTFLDFKKQVGETVQAGEVIAEVEADKATIEIESTASGTLLELLVKPGDTVTTGMPLARVGAADEKAAAPAAQPAAVAATAPQAAPAAAPAPTPPMTPGGRNGGPAAAPAPAPAAVTDGNLPGGVRASPIARRMAGERGIDLKLVVGSGPGGRITKADVESFQPPAVAAPAVAPAEAAPITRAQPTPRVPAGMDIEELPISRMRQRIAARTIESKQNVPHFYVTVEIDMAAALALRKQINEGLPDDQKVTVNDMVVKAAALALRQFPNLNSHYYGDKVVRHKRINIGIAVALEGGGLINVVAHDADMVSISRLAQRNKEMIAGARAGKVKLEDLEGSTFTVSNLGPYDVEHFEAIINPPEAGILAVSSARQVPVVVDGEIKVGTRMKATISVDHRVSDGAEAAQFMVALRTLLENPMRLLL